ncbi:MAG: hypothetical protein ACMUEK_01980 [Sodalis sp. (in: enterobacteria)]
MKATAWLERSKVYVIFAGQIFAAAMNMALYWHKEQRSNKIAVFFLTRKLQQLWSFGW